MYRQAQQGFQQGYQQAQNQFQRFRQDLEPYTSNRRAIAAAVCALGGVIVVTLSLIGGAAEVDFLQRSGYSWWALIFYLLVTPLAIAIWRHAPFSAQAACGLIAFDFILDIISSYYSHSVFPEWLVLLKPLLFIPIIQVVWEEGEDDEEPPEEYYEEPYQQGPYQQGGWQ